MIVQNESREELEGNEETYYSMCPSKLGAVPRGILIELMLRYFLSRNTRHLHLLSWSSGSSVVIVIPFGDFHPWLIFGRSKPSWNKYGRNEHSNHSSWFSSSVNYDNPGPWTHWKFYGTYFSFVSYLVGVINFISIKSLTYFFLL